MNHLMVDLETLSQTTDAVMISLGAVIFDAHGDTLGETLHLGIDLDDQLDLGGFVSGDTIHWHFANTVSKGVKFPDPLPLGQVLSQLSAFYERHGCKRIWSNGATFDIPILKHWYRRIRRKAPWYTNQERDTRTAYEIAWGEGYKIAESGTKHDALDDAIHQAVSVQQAYASIKVEPFKKNGGRKG